MLYQFTAPWRRALAQGDGFRVLGRRSWGAVGLILGLLSTLIVGCTATPALNQGDVSAPPFETQLAQHLDQTGAKMYGAYWCPHCQSQKEMFGAAVSELPYVECDPKGESPQPELCQETGIQGYPTWEINGELYPGVRSLEELAYLSSFEGEVPTDTNSPPQN